MNEAMKERLSAFMDDEVDGLDKDQVGQLLKNPELLDTWSRYHLLSDCLRQNLPRHLDRELADRVSKSIENEPTVLAQGRFSRSITKPAAGFAIAASVAALAIFGIQQQQPGGPHEIPQGPLVQSAPGSGGTLQAPVRQVSTATGGIANECNNRPAAGEQTISNGDRQAGGNEARETQSGVNCP